MIGLVLATLLSVHSCQTLVVTKANMKYRHYATIQSAVDAAKPCDWVVVAPGVYPEKVVIRTANLHVRGLNRNMVIVDGAHRVGNGIEVQRSSNVWIENLTVRNFDRATRDGEDGNEIWWNGGDESGTIGATPAVQNAVVDALSHLGVRHVDMPLTPERVWRAIQAFKG